MITPKQVERLIGLHVEMLCFAQFCMYMHFEAQILLTVEASFEHVHGVTRKSQLTTFPATESSLIRILDCSIVSASVDPNGDLHLTFSNGDTLRVYKQPEFESYQLRIGNEELIG